MSVLNWAGGNYNVLPGGERDSPSYPETTAAVGWLGSDPSGPECTNPRGGVGSEGNLNMAGIIGGEQ